MADLGTLPSTQILSNSPGSTRNRRRGGWSGGWGRSGSTQQQTQQQGGAQPAPQTFSQMQQAGLARPGPMQVQSQQMSAGPATAGPSSFSAGRSYAPDVGSQYTQSVSNALQAPSRYDLPQVQQVRNALTGQLEQQFGADAKKLDEQMAQRGLSASSLGGGYQGDLRAAQATALANMNAQLIQGQAATSAGDLAASLGAGANWQSQQNQAGQFQQSLAQQQLENQQQFGLQQGTLTGNYGGQSTLGAAQQALAERLGLGNLALGQQQLSQQGSQFGQEFGQRQLESQQQYGLSQAQQQLAQQLGLGNLDVSRQQLAQQGSQFGQEMGQRQLENQQQYGLSQAQQELARQLGMGNLGLGQAQLAQEGQQFGQSLAEQQAARYQSAGQFGQEFGQRQLENQQQYGLSQAQQDLARQLGLGNLGVAQGGLDVERSKLYNQSQQFNQQFGLDREKFGQQQLENAQNYGLQQGGLMGYFNGQQTSAERQNTAQNQFRQGELTGNYNGAMTLPFQQMQKQELAWNADRASQEKIAMASDDTNRAQIDAMIKQMDAADMKWLAEWIKTNKPS